MLWETTKEPAMHRRKLFALALVASMGGAGSTPVHAQGQPESLASAWTAALAADHRIRSAASAAESAEQTIAAAQAAGRPSITVQAGYTALDHAPAATLDLPPGLSGLSTPTFRQRLGDSRFFVSNVTLTLPLYTGGQVARGVAAASAARDAARHESSRVVLDLKLSVAEAYLDVLRDQRAREVAQSSVIRLRSFAADVQALYGEGMVPKNDRLAAEVALADARQREIQASNRLDVARGAYNRLLGRPLTDPVELEEIVAEPVPDDLPALTRQAIATRPELAALAQEADAVRMQAAAVRAGQVPEVALSGGNSFVQNQILVHESVWSASISVRWQLFDGGRRRYEAGALDRSAEAVGERRLDALTAIELQVREAWLDVGEAEKRMQVTQAALAQSEENLTVSRDRYAEGIGTNTEVLDAEALRVQAATNYYNAVYDAVGAHMRLRRAVGDL